MARRRRRFGILPVGSDPAPVATKTAGPTPVAIGSEPATILTKQGAASPYSPPGIGGGPQVNTAQSGTAGPVAVLGSPLHNLA